jgi:ribosomal protein S18 acetylase RimI-like enzyme
MRLKPSIEPCPPGQVARLLPLLRDAEEGDARIIAALGDPAVVAYVVRSDGNDLAAAAVRWAGCDSEIVYLATHETVRGQGYGAALMRGLIEEAGARGVEALYVGSANSSLRNIAFYQKRGFRMVSVREDFFDYLPAPLYENGIRMRDMLMLRLIVAEGQQEA